MEATQMNVRMDASLKRAGDAVISQLGYTPSRVVRALWEYLSLKESVPRALEGILNQGSVDSALAASEPSPRDKGSDLVAGFYRELGVSESLRPAPDPGALRDEWAEERLARWRLS